MAARNSTGHTHTRYVRKYRNVSIMDEVENLELYEPGGLHPVLLGDILDGRFEVNYKLGCGGIATVWLCYDLQHKCWKAVKINAAERSGADCPDLRAIELLKRRGVDLSTLDEHIALPEETFWVEGPNGRHLCSVLPVLGPTVYEWRQTLGTDEIRVNDLCYQITKGLSFLHSQGICHGDFRPDNILMRLRSDVLDQMGRDEVRQMLGPPEFADVLTTDGKHSPNAPGYVVTGISAGTFRHLVVEQVAIIDFGEPFEASKPPAVLGIPRRYAAPELLFGGHQPGPGSDLFAFGCTIYELRMQTVLDDDLWWLTQNMERVMGPVPPPYRRTAQQMIYEHQMEEYEANGDSEERKPAPPDFDSCACATDSQSLTPIVDPLTDGDHDVTGDDSGDSYIYSHPLGKDLATSLRYYPDPTDPAYGDGATAVAYGLSHPEVLSLANLLRQLFKYDPGERMEASSVLEHEWFRKTSKS
ncbi:hypothetical protein SLS62_005034 [Diatrype stigma]|uniref:EKC/KEOPS complex subunit BUD32 n=1 Tax=Diatrype stigma TaxID=117547 RepID=A0AAN9UPW9_9PEZI